MRILYESPSRQEKEQSFFDSFLTLATDVPPGAWERGERPDYVLTAGSRRFGLEITTLIGDASGRGARLAAIRRSQDKVLRMAADSVTAAGIPPLEVKVMFRDNNSLVDEGAGTAELLVFVRDALSQIDETRTWTFNTPAMRHISRVHIHLGESHGRSWLDHHRWSRLHINWVRIDPIAGLQNAVDKKAKLHASHLARCDECWLLVGVHEWTAPEAVTVTGSALPREYRCPFARLYFLKNVEGRLYRLRIAPGQE